MNSTINIADLKFKAYKLNRYDLADKRLNKIFKQLETENDGLLSHEHYRLNGGYTDSYGNYYENQIKISKEGDIFLSRRYCGEICNSTDLITVEQFIKSDGNLDELLETLHAISKDISNKQTIISKNLYIFNEKLEALL